MQRALLAQVGDRFGWSGFWVFLVGVAVVIAVGLYLFMRSQPPGGPRVGE
jgi:sugar phosphate permease